MIAATDNHPFWVADERAWDDAGVLPVEYGGGKARWETVTETIALVVEDQTVDLAKLAEFVQLVGDVSINEAVLMLQRGNERCYVVEVSDPEADGIFDDWRDAQVPKSPSSVFSVDYRAPDLVIELVHSIAQRRSLIVDTNYGQVVYGGELVPGMLRHA